MATVAVGVIGTGNIGTAHAQALAGRISGARVAAVFDVDASRAAAVAEQVGADVHDSALGVVDAPGVDAVLIASPGELHADQALACLAAGKPVLCEKPLSPNSDEALKVVHAEVELGRRLIQVGFMRRYDPGYRQLRSAIESGAIGEALLAHCIHRNASAAPGFSSAMSMTDSVVHEIDVTRWLFDTEIVAVTVVPTRPSPLAEQGVRDPALVLLETADGRVIDVEVFVRCGYGYEVRCEVVGSTGVATLDTPSTGAVLSAGGRHQPIDADWRSRFADAYRIELQEWIDSVRAGTVSGPSAWDGYAATAVAEACVESLATTGRVPVRLAERPGLYS